MCHAHLKECAYWDKLGTANLVCMGHQTFFSVLKHDSDESVLSAHESAQPDNKLDSYVGCVPLLGRPVPPKGVPPIVYIYGLSELL